MRAVAGLLPLALAGGLLVGCGSDPAPPAGASPSTQALTGELRQFRRDRATRTAQVTLTARVPTTVTGIGLSAPGFEDAPVRAFDTDLPVGGPLDVPVAYGRARCASAPGPATATVLTTAGTVLVPLTDDGLLVRLHEGDCFEQALAQQVALTVSRSWVPATREGRPALQGWVDVVRTGPGDRLVVDDLGANVLFAVSSPGSTGTPLLVLEPGVPRGRVPVLLTPSRCDPHALAESHRTSLVTAYVGLGAQPARLVTLVPDDGVRRRLEDFALATCRARNG